MSPMAQRSLILLTAVVLALAGMLLVRRRTSHDELKENTDFAALSYAIIGAVYGVYLAFTIVVVWDQFGEAEQNAASEAVYISQVWRDVQVLPAEARMAVEATLIGYADSVIQHEWPSMAADRIPSPVTAATYEALWRQLYAVRPLVTAPGDQAFFNEAVVQMNALGMSRRLRLLSASAELPAIMWDLLVVGGLVTVVFTYAIGTRSVLVQGLMTAAVAGLVVFSLLIVAALQHPFQGDVAVTPEAMQGVRDSFEQRRAEHLDGVPGAPAVQQTVAPAPAAGR